jgi:hypothetical protein
MVEIGKRRGIAPACVDEPFGSERHNWRAQINTDFITD